MFLQPSNGEKFTEGITMKSFKEFVFIVEERDSSNDEPLEITTDFDLFDPEHTKDLKEMYLYESVSSNDKGVLHELLTGYHLNGGQHMSPDAKKAHDEIKSRITKDEYDNAHKMAQGTANHIHKHFDGNIKSVQGQQTIDILKEALFKFQLERNGLTNTPYEITLVAAASLNGADIFASLDWEEISR